MKTIYLDREYKCHTADDGTGIPVETDFFDGKWDAFVEGYRYVPAGKVWVREDGRRFSGPMLAPWRDYSLLAQLQQMYEQLTARQEVAV